MWLGHGGGGSTHRYGPTLSVGGLRWLVGECIDVVYFDRGYCCCASSTARRAPTGRLLLLGCRLPELVYITGGLMI